MKVRLGLVLLLVAWADVVRSQTAGSLSNSFVNFETAPVHPIALSPDGQTLAVCNLPDAKLELFDVSTGALSPVASIPVGIDPVTVRFRSSTEVWVVNHISDSISVVDVDAHRVTATIDTLDTPEDVVFAGVPARAFVSCALPNRLQVIDPITRQLVTNVVINAERPKALAVSADGQKVYAAIFESANGTTVVGARFRNLLFFGNAVSAASGPYGGHNPPPNFGDTFNPPLNPAMPTNVPAPLTGMIVRKNSVGRWMDDNAGDWTEFVSGTNAPLTQRVQGWDLPDRDVAIVNTSDYSISYATGLMNICMSVEPNPATGKIVVVGTDAINEVRFEPNLNGIFVRVNIALVDPITGGKVIKDLNPHLDYTVRSLPEKQRDRSIGDPRAIAWRADGTRGYVAGMGSRNVVAIDGEGNRSGGTPIEVGEGPCGLALDEARQRLYVYNRFSSSISVIDTGTGTVISALTLFDPTPVMVAAGRRHLYDTRRTSGLGQASCASCHVDGRMDRLGWDLGNPAGQVTSPLVNSQGTMVTNNYHPMKGVMVTQTLQDIIGHEPFHWRGDRPDIESFNQTFTNLQAAATGLSGAEMRELREFLGSIRFPPNPYRQLDNSLSTNVPLPGHVALGENVLPAGAPLPNGNALAGLGVFNQAANFCVTCHSLPTGLGVDSIQGKPIALGPNGEHHFPLAFRLEGPLRSKIAQFRNMAEKIGMDGTRTQSRAGFGFGHDGSIDSLTRFLNGVRVIEDRDVADLIAFLLSVSGSDTGLVAPGAPPDASPPAAVGRQLTIISADRPPLLDAMLALARSPTSRVDLIAKGFKSGIGRGWFYDRETDLFQSDRELESLAPDELLTLAQPGNPVTLTLVSRGAGIRLGIDRDLDGMLDRDELDAGDNPADSQLLPQILGPLLVPFGGELAMEAHVPPLPATGQLQWRKGGVAIDGATNFSFIISNASFDNSADYTVTVTTPFQSYDSLPFTVRVVPLLLSVTPDFQRVRLGSNAQFTATATGSGSFNFQWQFNDQQIAGATAANLAISNVQLSAEGQYRVVAANQYGSITSAPVAVTVLINPAVVSPPLSQAVVMGGNATFSFIISGHPSPFGYQLRKGSVTLTNYTTDESLGFVTLFNVQPTNAGTYRIVVTNAANPSPGLSFDPVTLTVLADTDHDGLPDDWENAHGLNPNDPADAELDFDLDGQSNWQEYVAGTDPQDRQSFLKLQQIVAANDGNAALIQFNALSNRTYTVQCRNSVTTGAWTKVLDIVAAATNRTISITNAVEPRVARYYRLVTPRVP